MSLQALHSVVWEVGNAGVTDCGEIATAGARVLKAIVVRHVQQDISFVWTVEMASSMFVLERVLKSQLSDMHSSGGCVWSVPGISGVSLRVCWTRVVVLPSITLAFSQLSYFCLLSSCCSCCPLTHRFIGTNL